MEANSWFDEDYSPKLVSGTVSSSKPSRGLSSFGHGIVALEEGLRARRTTLVVGAILVLRVSSTQPTIATDDLASSLTEVTSRRWFTSVDGVFSCEFVRSGGIPQVIPTCETLCVVGSELIVSNSVFDLPYFGVATDLLRIGFESAKSFRNGDDYRS